MKFMAKRNTNNTLTRCYTIRKDTLEKLTLTRYLSNAIEFRQKYQPGYFWKITFVRQAIFIIIVFDTISIQNIRNNKLNQIFNYCLYCIFETAYTLRLT